MTRDLSFTFEQNNPAAEGSTQLDTYNIALTVAEKMSLFYKKKAYGEKPDLHKVAQFTSDEEVIAFEAYKLKEKILNTPEGIPIAQEVDDFAVTARTALKIFLGLS